MRIAICDMVFNRGHKNFNKKIIDLCSSFAEVRVFHNDYYVDKTNDFIPCKKIKNEPSGKIFGRIKMYFNLRNQIKLIKKDKIDYILILSCEWISLSFLVKKILKKARMGVIHHNLNQFDSKLKFHFFNKYKNKIDNIVLDDFLLSPLNEKYGVDIQRSFVLHHPQTLTIARANQENYISLLSGSVNQDKIIELFEKKDLIQLKENYLFIKNKSINYKDDKLTFTTKYLSNEEYENMISKSKIAIFMFPDDFIYHVSGVLIDNLLNGKIVFSNPTLFSLSLKEKYSSLIYIYKDLDELINLINKSEEFFVGMKQEELEMLKNDRSEERIKHEIEKII